MEILYLNKSFTSFYLFLQTIVILSLQSHRHQVLCSDDDNRISDRNRNSNLEKNGPLSTPDHLIIGPNITDLPAKLVRLIVDAEYRDARNKALGLNSPPINPFSDASDRTDPIESRIHVHHIFPPAIIRPIQRLIGHKIRQYIKHDPIKKAKKILLKKTIAGAAAVGLVSSASDIIETVAHMKDYKETAKWRVTGYEDLSSDKRHSSDAHDIEKDYNLDHNKHYGHVAEVKTKHSWPFPENEDAIYEKWNRFPRPTDPPIIHDPRQLHDNLKLFHHTLHEIHPTVLDIVHDVHHMFGKSIVTVTKPESNSLKDAIVSVVKLLKFADNLIPTIRVRIPLIDEIKKLAHLDGLKKKVVYTHHTHHTPHTKVKYIGVPYVESGPHFTQYSGVHAPVYDSSSIGNVGNGVAGDSSSTDSVDVPYVERVPDFTQYSGVHAPVVSVGAGGYIAQQPNPSYGEPIYKQNTGANTGNSDSTSTHSQPYNGIVSTNTVESNGDNVYADSNVMRKVVHYNNARKHRTSTRSRI